MKKLLVFIFLAALASVYIEGHAQIDESRNFVYFSSDSILYAKRVRLHTNFFGTQRLEVDGTKIPTNEVKFFKMDEGFFGNLAKAGKAEFAERVVFGKINLYKITKVGTPSFMPVYGGGMYGGMHVASGGVSTKMYYNKGYEGLEKVKYASLMLDMADNPESIDLLGNYRKRVKTSTLLYVGAGAAIIGSFVSILSINGARERNYNEATDNMRSFSDYKWGLGLAEVGLGLGLGGHFTYRSSFKKLEAAFDVYNR